MRRSRTNIEYRTRNDEVRSESQEYPAKPDYPAKLTVWYLDVDCLLPLAMEGYDWDDQLSCSYVFKDIKLNVGLGDADFAPEANGVPLKK